MSQFINGSVGLNVTIHAANDYRNCDGLLFGKGYRAPDELLWSTENRVADNATDAHVYKTRWWPRSSQILGGWGDGLGGDTFQNKPTAWNSYFSRRGANGRLGYVGYTRDQYGSALGNCTVRLIRVSTDEMVAKVTSDANGLYFATTPYSDAHFLVIHGPGGTLAGATKDSLLPA